MQTLRLKDIIGPVMIGPSSSHTAGALRIASMARRLLHRDPVRVEFKLYGSFAHTYRGHGTDRALVAGILGLKADDDGVRTSLELARERGVEVAFTPLPGEPSGHPNTVVIEALDHEGRTLSVRGESIGGGAAVLREINGVELLITGEHTSIVVSQRDVKGVLAHIATMISEYDINIATTRMYREKRGERAFTVMETDRPIPTCAAGAIAAHPAIDDVRVIPAESLDGAEPEPLTDEEAERLRAALEAVDFDSGAALLEVCRRDGVSISEAFIRREEALGELEGDRFDWHGYLEYALSVMRESATRPAEAPAKTMGGLIGGEAAKLAAVQREGGPRHLLDPLSSTVTRYALSVLETNASMGRIVAAPTAGSSGVVPAVLLGLQDCRGFSEEEIIRGLACAGAVGYIISRNACVSGAEGGCQAEIGSAAGMAAAAAVELAGGTPEQALDAASNAIANMLGLVCDPIGGLVEAPCQKRNASGAANALVSAQIALTGVRNLVPFDETVDAMYKIGRTLPFELRESALGGMAATPSACAACPSPCSLAG